MTDFPDNNPKSAFGATKPDLSLIPPSASIYMALGFGNGAEKYGPYNYRENGVAARVYVAAAIRHLLSWQDGEELDGIDPETGQMRLDEAGNPLGSGLPHLGHALASIAIIVDAIETGNLVDNRPISGNASALIAKWTKKATPPVARNKAKK